mmetsp:Transcript_27007/g.59280  ORF Transcript_27007/g.59280 Transcript_27007/m.59280 type:complete len:157 (+) Transcript_27007:249-719(+)
MPPEPFVASKVPKLGLAITSVETEGTPLKTLQQVAAFLGAQGIKASIRKITAKKASMEADVFVNLGRHLACCLLQIQVYCNSDAEQQDAELPLTLEFLRFSGDSLAFAMVFEKASAYLQGRTEKDCDDSPVMSRFLDTEQFSDTEQLLDADQFSED